MPGRIGKTGVSYSVNRCHLFQCECSVGDEDPGFIYIDHTVTVEEIRMFLTAMVDEPCSKSTLELFGSLSLLPAAVRLAENLSRFMAVLAVRPVTNILVNGLLELERQALLELERLDFSVQLRGIAHNLLNIKERFQLNRQICGYFGRMRHALDGHITLGEEHDEGSPRNNRIRSSAEGRSDEARDAYGGLF